MRITSRLTKKLTLQIIGIALGIIALAVGKKVHTMMAAPIGERDCHFAYPIISDTKGLTLTYKSFDGDVHVLQRGGYINDVSCLNKTHVYAIVEVRSEEDARKALALARENNLKVTPSGEHHSMGGQSFSRGGLVLDMRGLDAINVNKEEMTMTIGSGASWKEAQAILDPMGLAIKAMQSINIFTVGGTLSVNAHGVAHDPGQIAPTVRSLRIMLSSGEVAHASRSENTDLFKAVLGGYGLSGIILDATLDIVPNEVYAWETEYIDIKDFPAYYREHVEGNPEMGLMYGRLSIAPGSYLQETAVHMYTKNDLDIPPEPLGPSEKVGLKRLIFNISKTGAFGRWIRWTAEKYLEPGVHTCVSRNNVMTGQSEEICVASRNQKMNQSMEYLSTRIRDTNILHEYFVPLDEVPSFIEGLKTVVKSNHVNMLNVTLRIVTKDTDTALPYAKDDRVAFVLYFNQKLTERDSKALEKATKELIDLSLAHGGTFYLPYQLYYSPDQLRKAYPEVDSFFATKKIFDPAELFSNTWYEKYGS